MRLSMVWVQTEMYSHFNVNFFNHLRSGSVIVLYAFIFLIRKYYRVLFFISTKLLYLQRTIHQTGILGSSPVLTQQLWRKTDRFPCNATLKEHQNQPSSGTKTTSLCKSMRLEWSYQLLVILVWNTLVWKHFVCGDLKISESK